MSRTADLLVAAARLWNVAQRDTGQSRVCVSLLLGLYNGRRFPFDLTDLRLLDADLRRAAFDLLAADAAGSLQCEVHELLNRGTGRTDFGPRFEALAYDWAFPRRCAKHDLVKLDPPVLRLRLPDAPAAPAAPPADVLARPWAEPN
jgi:hypothetical protein